MTLAKILLVAAVMAAPLQEQVREVRSARGGLWSAPDTWEGGAVPGEAARVRIREGHRVIYDVSSDKALRSVLVAGTLSFAPDRDTRLRVGLMNIQSGDAAPETGFDCDAHLPAPDPARPKPALEVGTPDRPVDAGRRALIQLIPVEGLDRDSCPAIVCCGGRMDLHGAPLSRTWVKLGAPAKAGEATVSLLEPVTGWRIGDRVIVTSTSRQNKVKKTFRPSVRDGSQTEERLITAVDGTTLTLDAPLAHDHSAEGDFRGEVANLSRNVVVESERPDVARGHTMYHRDSAGSISYAEFRHLGKEGVLGRYSLHFHRVGDTMRGSSVIGASIWDSGNRWITIHGTNYLVVRDCVGYRSVGHGFFLEDGTEVYNILDRNLAVQAFSGKTLPKQVLPYDKNDGSGFWWANSMNAFTRNVAADCDEYGYFFQVTRTPDFDPTLRIQQPDGSRRDVDVRTLPFLRFDGNEAHTQRRHALNLGGGVPFGEPNVGGVGPDPRHPFILRNTILWDVHWAFHPVSPSVLVDGMKVFNAEYGIWRPVYKDHAYRGISMDQVTVEKEFSPVGRRTEEAAFPKPLEPADDLPAVTVITHLLKGVAGKVRVRGSSAATGTVKRVLVNGREARPLRPEFAEWELEVDASPGTRIVARADNEPRPHETVVR